MLPPGHVERQLPPLSSGGLQLAREGCRVWPIDCGPATSTNVHGRVQVGVGGEPTREKEELRLGNTIGSRAMPAATTGLTGVGRVDVDYRHPSQRRLVGDEGAELEERPTVQHAPLALNRSLRADPLADAPQIFQSDPARSVFCRADNGLADTVIHILGKPPPPPPPRSQHPLARL